MLPASILPVPENRLIETLWPANCGFDPSLLQALHLTGKETLSDSYHYQLHIVCQDETLPAKYLMGLPIGISILQADGSRRSICGADRKEDGTRLARPRSTHRSAAAD